MQVSAKMAVCQASPRLIKDRAGDFPNLEVKENGTAEVTVVAEGATLKKEAGSLLKEGGTSIVIHADPDDDYPYYWGGADERGHDKSQHLGSDALSHAPILTRNPG